MTETIAEQLPRLRENIAESAPAEIAEIFLREQRALASVTPEGIIEAGARLPDAELLDPHGQPITLSEALAGRPGVLVFYRGAWCPYCNLALRTYQAALVDELEGRGVQLVAVSPQRPDGSLTMQEKHGLRFPVLSDPGSALGRTAAIMTQPAEEALAAQLKLGLDLEAVNADGTPAIPMPTTVILDRDRIVQWVDVHPDYSTRSEPEQILAALDALARA
ncbi:MAG TPA: peroxiredoxin-like family protein [Solirubrobacteraceae bacterium]|nr:peroxiredoxin-like family protein [Solirubrobacteraceae bacterium]